MEIKSARYLRDYQPWMPFDCGIPADLRTAVVETLDDLAEFYAAGFFSRHEASLYVRYADALRHCADRMPLPGWHGGMLYPTTQPPLVATDDVEVTRLWHWQAKEPRRQPCLFYHHNSPFSFRQAAWEAKLTGCTEEERGALERIRSVTHALPWANGYTHCTVNYERILREGLSGYRRRIEAGLTDCGTEGARELYRALLITVSAAEQVAHRLADALDATPLESDRLALRRERLGRALRHVPMEPPRDFYEALVAVNFIFYFEGCDSPGRFDQYMWPFYSRDREAGRLTEQEAVDLIGEFWTNIDRTGGWNVALGGSRGAAGRSAANELTNISLEALKSRRRPNAALRIPRHADDAFWDKAFEVIATGAGLPALYNDEEYVEALRDFGLGISETDLREISFGGCTETMIQGCSNVGSLAANIHLLELLERTRQLWLTRSSGFEQFLARYLDAVGQEVERICEEVRQDAALKARFYPHMVRTLLVDDCIERGIEWCAGGARYNWEVVCLDGFSNVVDSLHALQALVFETGEIPARKMQQILAGNFEGYGDVLARIRRLPRYGQGHDRVDKLAKRVAEFTFNAFADQPAWRGGKFLSACLMFTTYANLGKGVGATADGRRAGEPLGDSFGPYQGRDTEGPTAMIRSITSFRHRLAPGTLVMNLRVGKKLLTDPRQRRKLRALIETYFARGGMQIQINVVDQATIREAIEHPQRHGNLIVRVGGYSEYFNVLSDDLKHTILERTIHA